MSQVYDNWERLVAAVIRKQQLWKLFHDQSRSPSICSESSESSSSINFEELEVNLSFAAKKEDDGESSLAAAFAEIFTFRELTIGKELEVNPSFDAEKKDDGKSSPAVTKMFTFRELANATKNFRADCILREGRFGRVYKGQLESTKQIVSIKQFDRDGLQGNREFLVEMLMLSLLHHPNMVNLIGHCADSDQRFAVYEYMPPLGYLGDHLHDLPPDKEPLPWNARMKIAAGVAKCLEYLHEKVNPPVIHRNLKCSNILLGEGYHPKLSDFGLAKLGPVGGKSHVSTRVMGTYGYCAPEYAMTGRLTVKADVYSFGVVLLEIITGGKAIDNSRAAGEHNLVAWARPLFKDQSRFLQMADPLLQGRYPTRGFVQALAVAAMCLQEQPDMRPSMSQVATATSYLALQGHHLIDTSSKGPADPSIPIM